MMEEEESVCPLSKSSESLQLEPDPLDLGLLDSDTSQHQEFPNFITENAKTISNPSSNEKTFKKTEPKLSRKKTKKRRKISSSSSTNSSSDSDNRKSYTNIKRELLAKVLKDTVKGKRIKGRKKIIRMLLTTSGDSSSSSDSGTLLPKRNRVKKGPIRTEKDLTKETLKDSSLTETSEVREPDNSEKDNVHTETYASIAKKTSLSNSITNDGYTVVTRAGKQNKNISQRLPYNVDRILSLKGQARINGLNNLRKNLIEANLKNSPAVSKLLQERKYANFKICLFNISEECRNAHMPYCSKNDQKYMHCCIFCKILFAYCEQGHHTKNCPLTQDQ